MNDRIPSGAELRARVDDVRTSREVAAEREAEDASRTATDTHAQLLTLSALALDALQEAGAKPRVFRRSPRQGWRIDQWEIESVAGYPIAHLDHARRTLLNYYDFRPPSSLYSGQIVSSRHGYPEVCPAIVVSPPGSRLIRVREWQEHEHRGRRRPRERVEVWKDEQKPEDLTEIRLFGYRMDGGPTALNTWRIDPWTRENSGSLGNLRESLISQAVHVYLGLKPPLARL